MNNNNNDLDELEVELKEQETEEEITDHKVSGHSVFDVERIIKEKSLFAEVSRDRGEKAQDEKEKEQR